MILRDIIPILEALAPPDYAMAGDRIGLQVGDPDKDIKKIIVTLDVTPAVIAEAASHSADLVVAHHPLIFNPISNVRRDIYPQSLAYSLVSAGISAYVMHTNFDCAEGGINDVLAERLGVFDSKFMESTFTERLFKLVTFVPEDAVGTVSEALSDAGAGVIGDYTRCSFRTQGVGTFIPMEGAEPYTGAVGELESASEVRLEVVVPKNSLQRAISAMRAAHPYEEVAYDVYPLWNKGGQWGMGRYGKLKKPMTFDGFCEMVRDALEVEAIRPSGDPDSLIETVAVIGGSGGDKVGLAKALGADVFVTGEVKHSQLLHAQAMGLNLIDATHQYTERPGMIALAPRLYDLLSSAGVTVEYVDDIVLNGG